MVWLLGEIWAWVLAGFLLGLLIGWWIWARRAAVTGQGDAEVIARLRAELDACTRARATLDTELAAGRTRVAAMTAELEASKGAPGFGKLPLGVVGPPLAQAAAKPLPLFLDAPQGTPDDVTLIKGIGPKLGALLNGIGIFHFRQIAGWSAADVATVDAKLGAFKGRIQRDDWVEQAKLLAAGRMSDYRTRFGEPETRNGE